MFHHLNSILRTLAHSITATADLYGIKFL